MAILMAALTFAAIFPTLTWMEFSNSMENLVVGTSLEIRRGGPVFVPTLEGARRIEKPPLTAWITAVAIESSTILRIEQSNPAPRNWAYKSLAVDIRWPALLASCLSLIAVYSLGKTILDDARGGLIAATICASSAFFLKYSRNSTTDVQLMLWVAVANAFLAQACLKRLTWTNAVGAGISIGLAFMSKGPVALVQTIIPVTVYLVWQAWKKGDITFFFRNMVSLRLAVAVLLAVAASLWWFLAVGIGNPDIIKRWLSEANPGGADRISSNNYFQYLVIIPFMLPWAAFIIDGWIRFFSEAKRGVTRAAYPVLLFTVTFVVMSCFHDRKDRYLLPMVDVASVLAARGVLAMLRREPRSIPPIAHWITLAVMAAMPLAGMTRWLPMRDGTPWFDAKFALCMTVLAELIVVSGVGFVSWPRRFRSAAPVVTAFALMMVLQAVVIAGYATSREGTSDMRPLAESIRAAYPDAQLFNYRPDGQQKRSSVDFSIYLNRITKWVKEPGDIPADPNHHQLYITLQNKGEPDPQPAPGWRYFDKVKRDKDWYIAFVREQ